MMVVSKCGRRMQCPGYGCAAELLRSGDNVFARAAPAEPDAKLKTGHGLATGNNQVPAGNYGSKFRSWVELQQFKLVKTGELFRWRHRQPWRLRFLFPI
jgi:hypothetical protein